jgi:hypothetical protein
MLYLINFVFHSVHVIVILASVFLCFFKDFIYIHLILQASILVSWFVIGPIFNQPGMCLITEVQRWIYHKYNLDFPSSYMMYLYEKFGIEVGSEKNADRITFSVFTLCTLVSISQLIRFNI